jgi:hypothetical protein
MVKYGSFSKVIRMAKKKLTFFIEPEMAERLKPLSSATLIKQADYIQEGIEMVFSKYQRELGKAKKNHQGFKSRI